MTLLTLEGVWKRFARGDRGVRDRIALRNVSLEVSSSELVAVVGARRSGRTTLLHVAAGVEAPSDGTVSLRGISPTREPLLGAAGGIGYCTIRFAAVIGDSMLEHVAAPLLGGDISMLQAHARAHEALRRVGATGCVELKPAELDPTELIRVSLARAIVTQPRLLLVDEPTLGVRPRERDAVLALLASIAHEDGTGVLITVDSATELAGADRALSLDGGELRGPTASAPVASVVPIFGHHAGGTA